MKPLRKIVYLAGPITLGDWEHNFCQGVSAQRHLMRDGYAVWNPMLSMMMSKKLEALPLGLTHKDFEENDMPLVAVSNAVLRLPGESRGADNEIALALSLGIPVFHSIEELQECLPVSDVKSAEAGHTSNLFAPESTAL